MLATISVRRGAGALAALAAVGALAVPAHADTLSDAYPSPQAIAANAEFLSQVPAPSGGAGTVCVIDTGVTPLPDTASQIVERIAIDGGTPDDIDHFPDDPRSGHGSFVASTIASQIDGRGSAGIWPAAKIISVRVFSRPDAGAIPSDYRAAVSECTRREIAVRVINISLGGTTASPYEISKLEDRINNARNVLSINVVASAGNDANPSQISYPARFAAAFAVGGTDSTDEFCGFSNRGPGLDVSSLGCDTQATAFDGTSAWFAGTSFSGPAVAGILLALRSYRPDLSAGQAEQLLLAHAKHAASGAVVDAEAAFRAAGLGALVDAYRSPGSPPAGDDLNRGDPSVTAPRFDNQGPDKPRLLRATYRKPLMRLRVAKPPRGWDAIFRVNRRSYVRPSGSLTVRVRSWKAVSVLVEDRWGVRSEPLKVHRPGRRADAAI